MNLTRITSVVKRRPQANAGGGVDVTHSPSTISFATNLYIGIVFLDGGFFNSMDGIMLGMGSSRPPLAGKPSQMAELMMQDSKGSRLKFRLGQWINSSGDSRRIGVVKYVNPIEGYSSSWIRVDWDNGEGKHDGSINGVQYFNAKFEKLSSFVHAHNLNQGISLLEALEIRY
ncbi:hypothetical protein L6164_016734 [Bauhinia variegata]|uniref:Uncharacterized protein n=1 Tax=Bauhinia variegata TaxID=167791 RepID=A0ACB9N7K0_BAUVA|nr:hypothetical protein L6164_016734 [Bauhinia variegata]